MPGDNQEMSIESMRTLATKYEQNAQRCKSVAIFLRNQNASLYWQSDAAASFKSHMNDYMDVLNKFETTFTNLAREVRDRAQLIEETQRNPARG